MKEGRNAPKKSTSKDRQMWMRIAVSMETVLSEVLGVGLSNDKISVKQKPQKQFSLQTGDFFRALCKSNYPTKDINSAVSRC